MDLQLLVEKLGLVTGGGLSIVDIQMVQWGRSLVFGCVYRTVSQGAPPDAPVHFSLVFNDCREIRYKVYAHIGHHESGEVTSVADVAEMMLGQGNHRRDAHILTNHFGVTLSYGEAVAEMNDHRYPLESR